MLIVAFREHWKVDVALVYPTLDATNPAGAPAMVEKVVVNPPLLSVVETDVDPVNVIVVVGRVKLVEESYDVITTTQGNSPRYPIKS